MEDQNKKQNLFSDENDLNEELDKELEITEKEEDYPPLISKKNELSDSTLPKKIEEEEVSIYLKSQLRKIQNQIKQMLKYLEGADIPKERIDSTVSEIDTSGLNQFEGEEGQIVEGVFNGEEMIGPDGKRYSIPSNYASKSKLVEGDILKLVIKRDGTFVYKQIGPTERQRLVGTLIRNEETNQYYVTANGERWKVLRASVTFFKGDVGDEAIILIPKDVKSDWAAIENIVRTH